MLTDSATAIFDEAVNHLKGIVVPVQPNLLSNINAAYPDTEAMSELLLEDPALCLSVLKITSNTNASASLQSSIREAAEDLGGQKIMVMLNAILLIMAKHGEFHSWIFEDYWETSRRVADIATMMARQLNIPLVEEAHCLGILHNVGMPFLWQKYPNYFEEIRKPTGQTLIEKENKLFNCDHATIGFYIAKGLHIDPCVCEAIRFHHICHDVFTGTNVASDKTITLLALLKLAESIVDESSQLLHQTDASEWELIKDPVLETLGLSDLDYGDLADMIQAG